ncbi:hypothetical protein [Brevundimonas sp.]|uniref:hypothetical protein n=1 Tax=Brevundimonas sp. TaxID=1871086 RepID=UPI0035AFF4AC
MVGFLAALYSLVVILVVVGGLWSFRQQSLSIARDQALAIAVFSAAYTSRMYDVADQVATQQADELSGSAPLTLDRLGSRFANASARTGLNDYIVVVDQQGHVVAASEAMMMRPARRDAHSAHAKGPISSSDP